MNDLTRLFQTVTATRDALTVRIGGDGPPSAGRFRLADMAGVDGLVAALGAALLAGSQPCV
jgi:hypothetical protein